jgi:hypothetical protein
MSGLVPGAGAQTSGPTLSASWQRTSGPEVLFPGQHATATLEVVLHPPDRATWDKLQVRLVARIGDSVVAAEAMPVQVSVPGSRNSASLVPGKWSYASYLGLGPGRSTVALRIDPVRATASGPLDLRFEVEWPGQPLALTGPVIVRCADFEVTDLRDPADPADDEIIRDGDTAWLTHYQDSSRSLPLMPRLVAATPGAAADHVVQWRLVSRYPRRGNQDDVEFPAEGWIELPGDQAWKAFATYHGKYFGGDAQISCKVTDPGGKPVFESTRRFRILCQNPLDSNTVQYIKSRQGRFWYAWAIAQHESRQWKQVFNQFNEGGRVANEPNFGAPDGWGLFQIDSARGAKVSTAEVWDWRTNAQAGFDELVTAERDTRNYFAAIQRTYPSAYEPPPETYTPPGCKTVLTAEEASIIQCYNGASIVRKMRNGHGTLSYYRSCWGFDPSAPSGKRWRFVKNRNNYVYKVVKHELEGGMPTE